MDVHIKTVLKIPAQLLLHIAWNECVTHKHQLPSESYEI